MQGIQGVQVNSYKSLRLAGNGYDIMYAVQCFNDSHELYNMQKDPVQMRNLHPSAPSEEGQQNAFHGGENEIAGFNITRLLPRVDALLLVLKSCKRGVCAHPWKELHQNGSVNNLRDAMDKSFDLQYESYPKVRYNKCFTNGTIDLAAEGPQWNSSGVFDLAAIGLDTPQVILTDDAQGPADGWDSVYWDDWE